MTQRPLVPWIVAGRSPVITRSTATLLLPDPADAAVDDSEGAGFFAPVARAIASLASVVSTACVGPAIRIAVDVSTRITRPRTSANFAALPTPETGVVPVEAVVWS